MVLDLLTLRPSQRDRLSLVCAYLLYVPHSDGPVAPLPLCPHQGTLLVLDEPTNHLDIPSKEMLEEAIRAFEGAVIAVSHDRYFLKQIATRVLLVRGGGRGGTGWVST